MLDIPKIACTGLGGETTVETLPMEVLNALTPTSSGNYKANVESFPAE
jgi:hypothetical protein